MFSLILNKKSYDAASKGPNFKLYIKTMLQDYTKNIFASGYTKDEANNAIKYTECQACILRMLRIDSSNMIQRKSD